MHGDTVPWAVVPLKEKPEGSLGIEAGAAQVQGILKVTAHTCGLFDCVLLFLFQSKHGRSQEANEAPW